MLISEGLWMVIADCLTWVVSSCPVGIGSISVQTTVVAPLTLKEQVSPPRAPVDHLRSAKRCAIVCSRPLRFNIGGIRQDA